MNLEVVRTFRAVINERGRPLPEWPDSIYAVQFALNSDYRERMGATPFQLMTGRVPLTAFSVFSGDGPDGWCVKEEEFLPEMMQKSDCLISHFPRRFFRVRLSLSSKCLPRFLACVGCSTPTTPRVLHRRHFFLLECDLRTFLLSSLRVPRFPRWRCLKHGCHEKRFRFVRLHHHQSMVLAGLHCQHRRVTYQLL